MTYTEDKLQSQRFELKYLIEESVALRIRDYLQAYLVPDEFAVGRPNFSYPIHSLYLDTPDLKLYQATEGGDKNRFKLRVRYYDDQPGSPVFLEMKRRMNNTIAKQRGSVHRHVVPDLLLGHFPQPAHMYSPSPRQFAAVENFCMTMNQIGAVPRTHVAYLREAWMSREDNSVRVTLDRQVQSELNVGARLKTELGSPVLVFGARVVLELKFTGRFPDWFRDLVQAFDLTQGGAAKYAEGINLLGVGAVSRSFDFDTTRFFNVTEKQPQPVERSPAAERKQQISTAGLKTVMTKG